MLCKEQEQRIKFTVIVANELNTDQLYSQKSTWFLFTSVSFGTPVSLKVQRNKNTRKQTKFEDTHLSLALVNGLHDFPDFPDRTGHA